MRTLINYYKSVVCFTILTIFIILLSACSGGGGSSSSSPSGNGNVLASVTVGSQGGTVTTSDGNVTLNIPSGALSSETLITIAESTIGIPAGTILDSYEFASSKNSSFNSHVNISIKYDPSLIPNDLNENDLKLAYASGGAWVIIPESTVDTVNHIVNGNTNHFTSYSATIPDDCSYFGKSLGSYNGVTVYSNACNRDTPVANKTRNCNGGTFNFATQTCINGTFTGLEWECVEFVNRYYLNIYKKDHACPVKVS